MKAYKGGKSSGGNESIDPNLLRVIQKIEKEQGRKIVVNIDEPKYSAMLLQLIKPFHSETTPLEDMQALLDLASIAWNMAAMKKIVPQAYNMMWQETKNDFAGEPESLAQLKKMVKEKEKSFGSYDMFIHEATLNVTPEGEIFVTATVKPFEAFAESSLLAGEEDGADESNFRPGYINRNGFSLTYKQPFLEWKQKMAGELFPGTGHESSVYLVEEKNTNKETDEWLKKNYDRVFKKELEAWYVDEKSWPKRRTYQMFREWFGISFHSMIYDMEDYPVDKDME